MSAAGSTALMTAISIRAAGGFYGQDCLYAFALRRCKVNFVLTEQSKEVYELTPGIRRLSSPIPS